jgi:hypothetical protein
LGFAFLFASPFTKDKDRKNIKQTLRSLPLKSTQSNEIIVLKNDNLYREPKNRSKQK